MASMKFSEMVTLAANNNSFCDAFPDELLLAIYWEETLFQNIAQTRGLNGKRGIGFGQVQEDTFPLINQRMGMGYEAGLVLQDDDLSAEIASYALETFRRGFKSGNPVSAYKVGYAGATETGKFQVLDGRTRGAIADAVWQAGRDLVSCGTDDLDGVRKALMKARPVHGYILDAVLTD